MNRQDIEVVRLLVGPDVTASEANLASSILYSRRNLESQAKLLTEGVEEVKGEREWALLKELVDSCSEATLVQYCCQWTSLFTEALKVTTDPAVHQQLCGGVSSLVARAHDCPQTVPDFASQQLPLLLRGLLWFSSSTPSLQVPAIRAAAHCHAHFTSSHAHHRHALLKWAESAIFHCYGPLSLEGARLMVLLCCHSNQKWVALVDSAVASLEWTLKLLLVPSSKTSSKGGPPSIAANSILELPLPLPNSDPERTAALLQLLDQLARTLTSSLLLPPKDHIHTPSIPVEKILGVVLHGLDQGPLAGHTTECRVVTAALPILHTCMWNILSSLIRTCHSHLFPYALRIRTSLVDEICSAEESPLLLAAVYRTMTLWVGVAKDYDASFINPVLSALLSPKSHAPSWLLQLQTLCEVVEHVGPVLPPSSTLSAIQRLPFEMLTPSTRPDHVCCLLRLQMACVQSRSRTLAPPLGLMLQLLMDIAHHYQDKQVLSVCLSAASQCSLLMHPSIVPLATLPPPQQTSLLPPPNSPFPHPSLPLPLHASLYSTPAPHMAPKLVVHSSTQTTPAPSLPANDTIGTLTTFATPMSMEAPPPLLEEEAGVETAHKRKRTDSSDVEEGPRKKQSGSGLVKIDLERDESDLCKGNLERDESDLCKRNLERDINSEPSDSDISSGSEDDGAVTSGAELFVDECSDTPDVVDECSDTPNGVDECSDTPDVVDECSDTPDVVDECSDTPDVVDECSDTPDVVGGSDGV